MLLLSMTLLLSHSTFALPPASITSCASIENSGEVETANARVEQVFKVEDDGFQGIAYVITYHGKRVIVQDPLSSTDYAVGDKIYFLVFRHDMSKSHSDGKKLISFMVNH
jgi:hypothetical protein